MKTFYIMQDSDNKPMIRKDVRDGEEGLIIFGKDPDHITPMRIINKYLCQNVLRVYGSNVGVHLFLPEKHMDLWSEKIGTNKKLQVHNPLGFRLDKMEKIIKSEEYNG